mmetsp:Transcript_27953/g.41282  ORF Transcript_27953/g.41282 Transcript_27953/m.41282 type:complete len:257 (-) Transcript_27953:40-810(-)
MSIRNIFAFPFVLPIVTGLIILSTTNCNISPVDAFLPAPPQQQRTNRFPTSPSRILSVSSITEMMSQQQRSFPLSQLRANNKNNAGDEKKGSKAMSSFIGRRIRRADERMVARDAITATCYVYLRYFVYAVAQSLGQHDDAVHGLLSEQLLVNLTGSLSSATVLISYWTGAGLVNRSFEKRHPYVSSTTMHNSCLQVLSSVMLVCPAWIITEHVLGFGLPNDIAGSSFSAALTPGCIDLSLAMLLGRSIPMKQMAE